MAAARRLVKHGLSLETLQTPFHTKSSQGFSFQQSMHFSLYPGSTVASHQVLQCSQNIIKADSPLVWRGGHCTLFIDFISNFNNTNLPLTAATQP